MAFSKICTKAFVAATLLAALTVICTSCGSSNIPAETSDSTSTPSVTNNTEEDGTVNIGDLHFTLSGDTRYENGVFCSDATDAVNTATCNDIDISSACIDLEFNVKSATMGGISFRYKNDDYRYFIRFDRNGGTVKVVEHSGDETFTLASANYDLKTKDMIKMRIAYHNTSLKIFIGDIENAVFPAIDMRVDRSRGAALVLDCGRGAIRYSSVKVSEYPYVLDEKERYVNPVATGADPYILQWDGKYYLYATNAAMEGFKVSVSEDLVNWEDKGFCLKTGDVYGAPTSAGGFWAPEVYRIDGRFYMFYSVDEHIAVAVADSPLGPFKSYLNKYIFDYRSIDGNLFVDDDGKTYIYYVKSIAGLGNEIYGAELDLKTLTPTNETRLIAPEENTWELKSEYIAEGPAMLKHNGVYYLTFSCNGYPSKFYAVGYATCSTPLGTFEKYENNPVLSQSMGSKCYGPGHHSFTVSPSGEPIIVYHRHNSEKEVAPRMTCIDRYAFIKAENGGPDRLVVYGPTGTPQKKPE